MRIALLALPLLLAACAQPATRPTATRPTATVNVASEQAINAVYAGIETATQQFDVAWEHYDQADMAAAAEAFATARGQLAELTETCLALPGCDVHRVIAAQDALIVRQGRQLTGLTEDAMPAAPDDGLAGEGASPILRELPEAARTVALLNGQDLAQVIVLNEPVKAALEEWLTWMRPQLLDAWENYQFMRHRMFPEYERTGLPEALLFGILAKESGGRVHAVSRAGAAGPLQFMPATGRRFGLGSDQGFDQRFDPAHSTRANAAYLNERFAELNGNLALALAAYNGGEGRVARLSNRGALDFWNAQVFSALPGETREYVPMVLAAAWLFLHPERYGLALTEYSVDPVTVRLEQEMSINELAVCLGQDGNPRGWFRHLRNLNPRWEAGRRLPVGTDLELPGRAATAYREHCLEGPRLDLGRELHAARPASARRTAASTYVVRKGDSLHAIARRHGCSVQGLASANGVRAPRFVIQPGQRLKLAGCSKP